MSSVSKNLLGSPLEGEVCISRYPDVFCIYGNPVGLRDLAQRLISLAE